MEQLRLTLEQRGFCIIASPTSPNGNSSTLEGVFGRPITHHRDSDASAARTAVHITASPPTSPNYVRRPQATPERQSPHTDGAYEETPPTLVYLLCLQNASEGGRSLLVDASAVFEFMLLTDPAGLVKLFDPDCYTIKRGKRAQTRAVFRVVSAERDIRVTVAHSTHEFNAALPSSASRGAFESFTALVRHPKFVRLLTLGERTGILMKNERMLHGREAWTDTIEQTRHFVRYWFPANGAFPTMIKPGFSIRPTLQSYFLDCYSRRYGPID